MSKQYTFKCSCGNEHISETLEDYDWLCPDCETWNKPSGAFISNKRR